jgi:hypothetical protein
MKGESVPNTGESNRYEIITPTNEDCKFYVGALNFMSQLVKCKAYAFKGNEKKQK